MAGHNACGDCVHCAVTTRPLQGHDMALRCSTMGAVMPDHVVKCGDSVFPDFVGGTIHQCRRRVVANGGWSIYGFVRQPLYDAG